MLDHRVYRAAFVPALVALFVGAFSLGDRPAPRTTRVAPDAFDAARAFGASAAAPEDSLRRLAADFPLRRPGDAGDLGVAERVARGFEASEFVEAGEVERFTIGGESATGRGELRVVLAEREGVSPRRVVVIAHRDAPGPGRDADLSGTAMLVELARVFADRDNTRTLVLASVSGGSGGFSGARAVAERLGQADAVLVLGDLASRRVRRPWVVPWSAAGAPAPHGVRRTVEAALAAETGARPGSSRAISQWARRAVPVTTSEQGVVNAAGLPAVLVSATGELGARPGEPLSQSRFASFGRGVLRAVIAFDLAGVRTAADGATLAPPETAEPEPDGIVTAGKLFPEWALRLLVLAILLPALLASVDAFFRVRRRRQPGARWLGWAAAWALPFLLAWCWLRLLDLTGAVAALGVAAPPAAVLFDAAAAAALGSAVLLVIAGQVLLRPFLVRRLALGDVPGAGGAAAAAGLLLSLLTLVVWVHNPYAASVLLPAVHLWLLAGAPESRVRGWAAVAAVGAGFVLPALVLLTFIRALSLDPAELGRLLFDLLAGGEAGIRDALALSLFAGGACAVTSLLRGRERTRRDAPLPPPPRTRGPASYAGPGSLGGTESALRR